VAAHQVLGVGLGFKFDHMKPPREGQPLSMRRLHARAAKSAIRRSNELRNPASLRDRLASCSDAQERRELAERLEREAAEEIEGIAQRLVDLVPPIFDFDDDEMPIKIEQLIRNEFVKASPTEFIYNAPNTDDLFFHVDSRNLQNNQEPSKSSIEDDSEFLDAWLQQQYKTGNAEAGDGDSSEICLA
jgi:hypothetical protein